MSKASVKLALNVEFPQLFLSSSRKEKALGSEAPSRGAQ